MVALRVTDFRGEIPNLIPTALPDTAAQTAVNVRLGSGGLSPINAPALVGQSISAGTETVFRTFNDTDEYWLTWPTAVDAVKLPVPGDTAFKTAFTSAEFEPRVTTLALATAGGPPYPYSFFTWGVPAPVAAPGLSVAGGSGTQENRAYVYTLVTPWGEESAPSPASPIQAGYPNGTWSLTGMNAAPANTYTITTASWSAGVLTLGCADTFGLRAGERVTLSGFAPTLLNASWKVQSVVPNTSLKITMEDPGAITDPTGTATRDAPHNTSGMTKRLYRAVTGSSATEYFLAVEVPAAQTAADDGACSIAGHYTKAACTGAGGTWTETGSNIGEALQTSEWAMPPVDLHALAALPNGAMVGLSGNEICFSEPGATYAWPPSYRLTMDYDGVGLAVFGGSICVGTRGAPYLVTGTDPASMSALRVQRPWPCLSARGMVGVGDGAVYPTTEGLAFVGLDAPRNLTEALFSAQDWRVLRPDTMRAVVYDGVYLAAYDLGDTGMILAIDLSDGGVSRYNLRATALYADAATGRLCYVPTTNAALYEWDADAGGRLEIDWLSKVFRFPQPTSLGAAKVRANFAMTPSEAAALGDVISAILGNNATLILLDEVGGGLNGEPLNTMSLNGSNVETVPFAAFESLQISFYVDGAVIHTETVTPTTKAFRLPSGAKYDNTAIRVTGNVEVDYVLAAETMDGLREV